jgi:hypothetical protein
VRRGGVQYAGRTLAYEECVRDCTLQLSPSVLAAAGGALELLLTSARWFTHEMARAYRDELRLIFDQLAPRSPMPRRTAMEPFWARAQSLAALLLTEKPAFARNVIGRYQARWQELLEPDESRSRLVRHSADLQPRVALAFQAPGPGYPLGQYQAPDLLIAARSVEAVQRGEYELVLGETHMGLHSMESRIFGEQHPDQVAWRRGFEADFPHGRVLPLLPRLMASRPRSRLPPRRPEDVSVVFDGGGTPAWRPPGEIISLRDVDVVELDGALYAEERGGPRRWDLVHFLEFFICGLSVPLLPSRGHCPRISVDRLVLSRERWVFEGHELQFAHATSELQRFAGARRWARQNGLPRFCYVKSDVEPKPWFIDLDSPLLVDLLNKGARQANRLTVTEMLPTPDECWLRDAQGRAYTSELRVVFVDPLPPVSSTASR